MVLRRIGIQDLGLPVPRPSDQRWKLKRMRRKRRRSIFPLNADLVHPPPTKSRGRFNSAWMKTARRILRGWDQDIPSQNHRPRKRNVPSPTTERNTASFNHMCSIGQRWVPTTTGSRRQHKPPQSIKGCMEPANNGIHRPKEVAFPSQKEL